MKSRDVIKAGLVCGLVSLTAWGLSVQGQGVQSTTTLPNEPPPTPEYVEGSHQSHAPIIEVYKDSIAWFGENRDHHTLIALGKIPGDDYFIRPISAVASGIPTGSGVVFFSSNGSGLTSARIAQNNATAQANLASFVNVGGILIIDMGDNDSGGGFLAPGSI